MPRMLLVPLAAAALATPAAAQASAKVTFPRAGGYEPGVSFAVKIVSTEQVRVALVQESRSGKVVRTIARRTLRTGTFTAALPDTGTYSVRVTAGARHWQKRLLGSYATCAPATAQNTVLQLPATTVPRGGTLAYDFVNTGDTCSTTGAAYSLEHRLDDGSWVPVPLPWLTPLIGYPVGPGKAKRKGATLPPDAGPGIYRLTDDGVAALFEVTA